MEHAFKMLKVYFGRLVFERKCVQNQIGILFLSELEAVSLHYGSSKYIVSKDLRQTA